MGTDHIVIMNVYLANVTQIEAHILYATNICRYSEINIQWAWPMYWCHKYCVWTILIRIIIPNRNKRNEEGMSNKKRKKKESNNERTRIYYILISYILLDCIEMKNNSNIADMYGVWCMGHGGFDMRACRTSNHRNVDINVRYPHTSGY